MQKLSEDILNTITTRKKQIVEEKKLRLELSMIKEKVNQKTVPVLRSFKDSLKASIEQHGLAIIAELKKASPSKGLLSPDYNPAQLAREYAQHHAACLSVLTEEDFFLGSDHDLEIARENCSLPVLRKDFIVDCYQIYESRLLGADCILLIAAVLEREQLKEFYMIAKNLGMDALIEVANEKELESALETDAELIGINNRNLRDFTIDLNTTVRLRDKITGRRTVICESGIHKRADVDYMLEHKVNVFLVGEALVKSPNPGQKLAELLGEV